MDVLVLEGVEEVLQLVRRLGVVGLASACAECACVRHAGSASTSNHAPARPRRALASAKSQGGGQSSGYTRRVFPRVLRRRRRSGGRWGCGACTRRWGSTRTTCTAAGVASVFWRSWARVIRGRHPSPWPATRVRARPRGCWRGRPTRRGRRCTPAGVVRGARAAAGLCVSGARRRGGYRLSRPCSG